MTPEGMTTTKYVDGALEEGQVNIIMKNFIDCVLPKIHFTFLNCFSNFYTNVEMLT